MKFKKSTLEFGVIMLISFLALCFLMYFSKNVLIIGVVPIVAVADIILNAGTFGKSVNKFFGRIFKIKGKRFR